MKMKNKRLVQEEIRKKRKEEQKAKRKEKPLGRKNEHIEQKRSFLIITEGETEESYFNFYSSPLVHVDARPSNDNSAKGVVDEACRKIEEEHSFDHVWAVYDKDDNSSVAFNNAYNKALSQGVKVAFSNQAFEYWILLHFIDHPGGCVNRDRYRKMLNDELIKCGSSIHIERNQKKINKDLYGLLLSKVRLSNGESMSRRTLAVKRARRIYEEKYTDGLTPSDMESVTTVFQLVEELIRG
ncbi:RloB family protein [Halosquirtibacter xylanolyticus]|uniref:RloB family protein n=1 Tax=Halosquirtibacter xylanolyticus TaxID=3374599 RepID=UPI003748F28C|nr:RloB family protein [Prolixibacteraceae bacterium]